MRQVSSRTRRSGPGFLGLSMVLGLVASLVTGCVHSRPTPAAVFPRDPSPEATLEAACKRAADSGRRVLLVFGADWCGDSRAMIGRLTGDSRIEPVVRAHYELVLINVGPRHGPEWDSPLVQRYGRPFAERGIPALVVVDSTGTMRRPPADLLLRDTDHRHPRKVRRFLLNGAGS